MPPTPEAAIVFSRNAGTYMFDIYLSGADLLVVPRGHSIPCEIHGSWRKKKRIARTVSDRIRDDIKSRGYHLRSLAKKSSAEDMEKSRRRGIPAAGHPPIGTSRR